MTTDAATFSQAEMMIVAAARELAGQRVCFVGVGLPNIVCNLAQWTVAPELQLIYESGVYGARPERVPLSIGDPTLATGSREQILAAYRDVRERLSARIRDRLLPLCRSPVHTHGPIG